MAEAAVSSLMQELADAALNRALRLYEASDQLEELQRDLRLIQAFLRDADIKRKGNPLVNQWVKEVIDVAYRIEDAMNTFLVEVEENPWIPPKPGIISRLTRHIKKPLQLIRLCKEIRRIQVTLTMIYERRTQMGIADIGAYSEENTWVPFRPSKLCDIDVSEVVGFDTDKHKIIRHLLDRSISRRTVLTIVGIGGLGKTTLAQKVYKSAELEGQFDCRTWLSISQKFNLAGLLRAILYSTEPRLKKRKEMIITDEELPMKLKSSLSQKRYLIILDDVWAIDLWDRLRTVLPDMQNGSRVVITSRSLDVAQAADCETKPYKIPYLNEDESLALLLRKSFQHNELNGNYPPYLIEVAKQLMKKCGGLPLALVVLGGILSRRERTYSAWSKVEQTMDWHNEEGMKCSQVLAMSYEDLPCHLKPCFLYFASFPEDYKVSAKFVTRMWVAEGFIPKDGVGTLEDRAEVYLEELAQRCLVQVIEKSWNGYCKYCAMHDLLRDLAIHESKEVNFLTVFTKEESDSQFGLVDKMARRVSLQYCTSVDYGVCATNTRAVFCFGQHVSIYHQFRLLKVLAIERIDMHTKEAAHEEWFKGLIQLRYLSFRYCIMPAGFEYVSYSFLKNLEVLDFKRTSMHLLNKSIHHSLWGVQNLRHVNISMQVELCWPQRWDHLKTLQTLRWVRIKLIRDTTGDMNTECINLRKIGIQDITPNTGSCDTLPFRSRYGERFLRSGDTVILNGSVHKRWRYLKVLLKRAKHLISLAISSIAEFLPFLSEGTSSLPCHERIQSLFLRGEWAVDVCVLTVGMFPTNLTKLTLESSRIIEEPMYILEKLKSLRILRLWAYSYLGERLICSTGGFPSLQKLELKELPSLYHWDIEEGAMPILGHLKIEKCFLLQVLPELQNVPTLQDLTVIGSSEWLYQRMQSQDRYKIRHIPSVRTTRR